MIREIIVVEGLHDKQKLESIDPSVECIVTNGTALSEATIALIQKAQERRGVILLLDPDHPGRTITKAIVDRVQGVRVAFLNQSDAKSKNRRKVGVEHAGKEPILAALNVSKEIVSKPLEGGVGATDLMRLGLSGTVASAPRRHAAASRLALPPSNAKTFLKWLSMFQITLEELTEACR
jgi:ribonuclease M5